MSDYESILQSANQFQLVQQERKVATWLRGYAAPEPSERYSAENVGLRVLLDVAMLFVSDLFEIDGHKDAIVNALAAPQCPQVSDENFFDLLPIRQSDVVGIVGYIEPIVKKIRAQAKEVVVFDEAKTGASDVRDVKLEQELLPQCDVVILSATSLLNKTFDALVAMSSSARDICVMGPSTPLLPEVFQTKGVAMLAGRQILDPKKVLQIVSEAGGTKRFGKVTRKVNLVLKQ